MPDSLFRGSEPATSGGKAALAGALDNNRSFELVGVVREHARRSPSISFRSFLTVSS
jgi:hypothetical protein